MSSPLQEQHEKEQPKKTILVLGATGMVGVVVVQSLLSRGHRVVAMVRDVVRARGVLPAAPEDALVISEGKITQPVDLRKALEGVDGVVSCIGMRKGDDVHICSKATRALAAAMKSALPSPDAVDERPVVIVGGGSTKMSTDNRNNFLGWLIGTVFPLFLGEYGRDRQEEAKFLERPSSTDDSTSGFNMNYTIVRCPRINLPAPSDTLEKYSIVIDGATPRGGEVRVRNLVKLLCDVVTGVDTSYSRRGVFVNTVSASKKM